MSFNNLILEKRDAVSVLTMNRTERLNSINPEMLEEFIEAVDMVGKDRDTRVLIITGAGRAFSSGADMDFLKEIIDYKAGPHFRRVLRDIVQKAINCVEEMEKPVIAAVNGPAAGGGVELSLACDFRIASEDARFIFTEVRLGFIPDGGGIPRLARLLGCGKAKEIILLGKVIDGREAERIGLVNRCVPPDRLMEEADHWAEQLLECAPMAVGVAKRLIDMGMSVDLMTALELTGYGQQGLVMSEDFHEGVRAFLEKRKPVFKGE